jgi:uncharacterized FlaG/YvyC family protein
MGSSAPPISVQPPQQPLRLQSSEAEQTPVAKATENRLHEFEASMRENIAPANLMIRYDESADRFVQTLTDANTSETLRRYPNDTQLAYSRAVMAYFRAMVAAVNKT